LWLKVAKRAVNAIIVLDKIIDSFADIDSIAGSGL
jgi:hypothetical protein